MERAHTGNQVLRLKSHLGNLRTNIVPVGSACSCPRGSSPPGISCLPAGMSEKVLSSVHASLIHSKALILHVLFALVFRTMEVTICMPSVSLHFRLKTERQPHQEPEDEEASQACDDHRVVPALEALKIGLVRHLSLSIPQS